jgi:hypothetical protein
MQNNYSGFSLFTKAYVILFMVLFKINSHQNAINYTNFALTEDY